MAVATGDGGLPAAGQTGGGGGSDEAARSRRSRTVRREGLRDTLRAIGAPNARVLNDNRMRRIQRIQQRQAAEAAAAETNRTLVAPGAGVSIAGRRRRGTARAGVLEG